MPEMFRPQRKRRQAGMTLIELMMAMTMLAVGLLAVAMLTATAISNNNRSKLDTSATFISQMVLEQIAAQPATQNAQLTLVDCNPGAPQAWVVSTAGAPGAGAGATVNAATGNIDYLAQTYEAVPNTYKMRFVSCGASGSQSTFEVRWNVRIVTPFTKLITVSSRQIGGATANAARLFATPVTLRTISGT
jgi:prepilin-type N-terminal cleavage/methylation domain-containing protein